MIHLIGVTDWHVTISCTRRKGESKIRANKASVLDPEDDSQIGALRV